MTEEEILRQPTWKEWLILKRIATCKKVKETYKKDWADRIGAKHYDPTFSRALKLLKDAGISECRPWIGNYNVVNINIKKLDIFIEESDIYKEFRQYVHNKELFVVGV